MEFINHYAVLNLPRDADAKQVRKAFLSTLESSGSAEQYQLCTDAYSVLRNKYKRARYDRTLGYLMMVFVQEEHYPSASVYAIGSSKAVSGYRQLIEAFRKWIKARYDLTWDEALLANFYYQLNKKRDNPYLLLRFPSKQDLEVFAAKAMSEKLIKSF